MVAPLEACVKSALPALPLPTVSALMVIVPFAAEILALSATAPAPEIVMPPAAEELLNKTAPPMVSVLAAVDSVMLMLPVAVFPAMDAPLTVSGPAAVMEMLPLVTEVPLMDADVTISVPAVLMLILAVPELVPAMVCRQWLECQLRWYPRWLSRSRWRYWGRSRWR